MFVRKHKTGQKIMGEQEREKHRMVKRQKEVLHKSSTPPYTTSEKSSCSLL